MAMEPTTTGELKHAIILPNWEVGADADLMVDDAIAAEEAGWDGVLLADHLVFPPQHSSAEARGGDLTPQQNPSQYRDFIDPWITMAGSPHEPIGSSTAHGSPRFLEETHHNLPATWQRWTSSQAEGLFSALAWAYDRNISRSGRNGT